MPKFNTVFDKRAARVRAKIKKVSKGLMRLSVHRSNKHLYAQVIDDTHGKTMAFVSSLGEDFKGEKCNLNLAASIGKKIGKLSIEQGVNQVVFDKGGYCYHGKVKAIADGAREVGLKI